MNFVSRDCDLVNDTLPGCTIDSEKYANDPTVGNDLDAVAQATPVYGAPYSGTWAIPSTLAAGDYAVWIEVNKEFDSNTAHNGMTHPSAFDNQGLSSYGLSGNFGQPSVVYRAQIRLDATTMNATGSADQIEGYSDWTGSSGVIMPPDATITTGMPGTGEGRLMEISGHRRRWPPAGVAGGLLACRLRPAAARRRGWSRICGSSRWMSPRPPRSCDSATLALAARQSAATRFATSPPTPRR